MSYVGKIADTASNTQHLVGSTLYGTCSTDASTAAKVVTCADFDQLLTGVTIHVKFTYQYTGDVTPTLNVNNTGAKSITVGTHTSGNMTLTKKPTWNNGQVVSFTYDGTNWCMNEYFERNTDTNVTQTEVTTNAEYEVTFAGSTGTTTRTEGVGKSQYFTYNPNKKAFTFGKRLYASTVGDYSVAEGRSTRASGDYSHAEGLFTTANHASQHVFGEHNIEDPSTAATTERGNYVEIVGNGTGSSAKSNARTLDWSGNEWLAGSLTIGNPDTAEYTGLKYDGSRGALTIVGGQQYSGAAFYEPILTVKNNSQTMGTASINITPENIYFQGDTWDGTNASLKDAISSLNSSKVSKSGDTLTGSLVASGDSVYLGSSTGRFAGLYANDINCSGWIGGNIIRCGTKIVTATAVNYLKVFTNTQLNTLFGTTNCSNGNCVVYASNGDYSAKAKYLSAVSYENGNWYVRTQDGSNFTAGDVRVNYIAIKFN